ncbi:MAG: sigma-70 family RNA polymerase sigma factor [Gemmataceae bacterium]
MITSTSLLDGLRRSPQDQALWKRLFDIYEPWIARQLRSRWNLSAADVDDLTQEILAFVSGELGGFFRERTGSFRTWLRHVIANRARGFLRKRQVRERHVGSSHDDEWLSQLADDRSELARRWDEEHNEFVVRRLLETIAAGNNDIHVRAFRRHVLDGEPAAAVAAELGVTPNVVFLAKSRILAQAREWLHGLLD